MRFGAPVRVGWFRLSFCVADSDDKDIDIDDERFSSRYLQVLLTTLKPFFFLTPNRAELDRQLP